jgi:1-acyl-sn-glycerol-3-phosphate acyltransferase
MDSIPQSKPTIMQEFSRLMISKVISLRYRIMPEGMANIPESGPAILAPNHVSYIDAMAIAKHCKRPIRFVMAKSLYDIPILNAFLKTQGVIPIASYKEDPQALTLALDAVSVALKAGEVVCIFPEGKLTHDGEIGEFKSGLAKILQRDPVPVIPLALKGLWGSIFTHRPQNILHFAKRIVARRQIIIQAGEPISPLEARPESVREIVSKMRGAYR